MAIKKFDCTADFNKFMIKHINKVIGSGSEGICYSGKDGYAYKIFGEEGPFKKINYKADEIVKESDFKNKSFEHFAFPIDVYQVGDTIKSYKTIQFVGEDLFRTENTCDIETIDCINFKKLSKAYKAMVKEVFMLSDENIKIYDIGCNIMFDGDDMMGVDTCEYKKNQPNVLARNIRTYNYAIEDLFALWLGEDFDIDFKIEGTDIDSYLKKLIELIPEDIKERNPKNFKL